MTTQLDHGSDPAPPMLRCELRASNLYPSLVLALRDMRQANGRDLVTGDGRGNESWIGLSLGMVILDTLSGSSNGVRARWELLLTSHGITQEDARIIYKLRCSLLHGYGLPRPNSVSGRNVLLTSDVAAHAIDTSTSGRALVSVPVFCGRLVERIAAAAPQNWDTSLIDTDVAA
ncbi:hypothetical protein [Streptomyces prunicolor]|uniref:Uncharacterized protein n=1 Tax=Streptomyces prunicolor TaxID=67348 RepID=A0ABU4FK34_9ACTN|nr:hypothetical protein [Streptomyces prunicolor]MDV7220410.1 hypothetical protein [Streptomyces prunicolor]